MSEVYLLLPQTSDKITYTDNRSVVPASLNAPTELMWAPGLNAASNSGPIDTADMPTDPAVHAGRFAFWLSGSLRGEMDAVIQTLIDQAVRDKLELVAKELLNRAGNAPYVKAWRVAAKIVRSHKPD